MAETNKARPNKEADKRVGRSDSGDIHEDVNKCVQPPHRNKAVEFLSVCSIFFSFILSEPIRRERSTHLCPSPIQRLRTRHIERISVPTGIFVASLEGQSKAGATLPKHSSSARPALPAPAAPRASRRALRLRAVPAAASRSLSQAAPALRPRPLPDGRRRGSSSPSPSGPESSESSTSSSPGSPYCRTAPPGAALALCGPRRGSSASGGDGGGSTRSSSRSSGSSAPGSAMGGRGRGRARREKAAARPSGLGALPPLPLRLRLHRPARARGRAPAPPPALKGPRLRQRTAIGAAGSSCKAFAGPATGQELGQQLSALDIQQKHP